MSAHEMMLIQQLHMMTRTMTASAESSMRVMKAAEEERRRVEEMGRRRLRRPGQALEEERRQRRELERENKRLRDKVDRLLLEKDLIGQ